MQRRNRPGRGSTCRRRRSRRLSAAGPLAGVVVSALVGAVLASPVAAETVPNIVVIVTDDQRAGTLRWMPTVRSLLVRRGTNYTRAFAPTPTCCPSRASLLTGLYAPGTTVWSNTGTVGASPVGGWPAFVAAGNEERTISTWLTPTYRTVLVGKYMNEYAQAGEGYVPPGWDVWHAFFARNASYYHYRLTHTDGSVTRFGERPRDYSTDVLADIAVSSIRKTPSGTPLMLYFAPYAPHGPTTPAPRHEDLDPALKPHDVPSVNERDVSDKPPWIQELQRMTTKEIEARRRDVFAALQAVDEATGRIIRALQGAGRLRNTLIIYTSDNGSSWGEHRIPDGNKFVPYMAQMHVPLVVRWDGEVASGVADVRLAANVDVAATLADAAGLSRPDVDGRSLLRRPRADGIPLSAAETLAGVGDGLSFARPAYCGYLTRRFLYTFYASGHEELFDLAEDPYELENLADRRRIRDVQDRLRARADAACTPRPPGF